MKKGLVMHNLWLISHVNMQTCTHPEHKHMEQKRGYIKEAFKNDATLK